jgi:hypothetical protein
MTTLLFFPFHSDDSNLYQVGPTSDFVVSILYTFDFAFALTDEVEFASKVVD